MTSQKDYRASKILLCDIDSCGFGDELSYLYLKDTSYSTTKQCASKFSQNYFNIVIDTVIMSKYSMTELMELTSQTPGAFSIEIRQTSLFGIKSLNLNKTQLHRLTLYSVGMDLSLCASLLKQIPSLTKLGYLRIIPWDRDTKIYRVQGNENFCHIPRDMCPEFLRSISHLHNLVDLDLSGNSLTGCLSNFISDSDSPLPSLQKLYLRNTALISDDINHIVHIIKSKKLPNLKKLNLDLNNFRGMDNQMDRLLNIVKNYYQM